MSRVSSILFGFAYFLLASAVAEAQASYTFVDQRYDLEWIQIGGKQSVKGAAREVDPCIADHPQPAAFVGSQPFFVTSAGASFAEIAWTIPELTQRNELFKERVTLLSAAIDQGLRPVGTDLVWLFIDMSDANAHAIAMNVSSRRISEIYTTLGRSDGLYVADSNRLLQQPLAAAFCVRRRN